MPMEDIKVLYSELDEFQKRPTSHTCSNVLEVPKSYDSFVELRHEFNAVLDSGVWVMDIIYQTGVLKLDSKGKTFLIHYPTYYSCWAGGGGGGE